MTPPPNAPIIDDTEGSKQRARVSLAVTIITAALSIVGSYFTWGLSQEHRTTRLEESVEQLKQWRCEQREDFKQLIQKLDAVRDERSHNAR